ncbi:GNAT family N-acetyltransferase [Phaeacidiphilus oryzae]|uniref:GNAT family N-acetyltransferase n=1 Tax=Phaeacidiphilus oryzae TaxID=348818 RepID=UPI000565682D|nr:GNAT family N-acetyltransferase [Phaeacidiphilus oryzae]
MDTTPAPPASLAIRLSRPEDGPALAELDRRSWSPVSDVGPRREAGAPFFDEGHRPEDYLVAEEAGEPVGWIRVVPPTPLASNAHVRAIHGLVVVQRARRAGIGRRLVEAACAHARGQGARRITLHVLAHNLAARRLYESCGFAVEGVQPEEFLLDGRYVDDVLMGRRLL